MIKAITYSNLFLDSMIYENQYRSKRAYLISLVGSEATVKASIAALLEGHGLRFEDSPSTYVYKNIACPHYKIRTKRLAPNIIHSILAPADYEGNLIIGRNLAEVKASLLRNIKKELPFMDSWKEYLYGFMVNNNFIEDLETEGDIKAKRFRYNDRDRALRDLKISVTKDMGKLRKMIPEVNHPIG